MTASASPVDDRAPSVSALGHGGRGAPELRLVDASPAPDHPVAKGRGFLTPARLEAFVAVAEEGGFSAAARRLHISQPALSQTINALERQLGTDLLVRRATGVQTTPAGRVMLDEARSLLARHDRLLAAMGAYTSGDGGVIRLGIPLELAPDVLSVVAKFSAENPETRVEPVHLPMSEQLAALRAGELDVSFTREHPAGPEFDTMLVARENLGVLLAEDLAHRLAGPDGVRLDSFVGLEWIGFPRQNSPAWYDQLAAILCTHGIDAGNAGSGDRWPIPSVMFTAVSAGRAFALVPRLWAHPIPHTVSWTPLVDNPVVRRTWAVWPASSRRRDVARLIAAFEIPEG
jgi:DNA-binding transcriptional LysR family regulator